MFDSAKYIAGFCLGPKANKLCRYFKPVAFSLQTRLGSTRPPSSPQALMTHPPRFGRLSGDSEQYWRISNEKGRDCALRRTGFRLGGPRSGEEGLRWTGRRPKARDRCDVA